MKRSEQRSGQGGGKAVPTTRRSKSGMVSSGSPQLAWSAVGNTSCHCGHLPVTLTGPGEEIFEFRVACKKTSRRAGIKKPVRRNPFVARPIALGFEQPEDGLWFCSPGSGFHPPASRQIRRPRGKPVRLQRGPTASSGPKWQNHRHPWRVASTQSMNNGGTSRDRVPQA